MTDKVKRLLDDLQSREYKKARKEVEGWDFSTFNASVSEHLGHIEKALSFESPVIYDDDNFGFNRGIFIKKFPWGNGNVTPDWLSVISKGFDAIIAEINHNIKEKNNVVKTAYGEAMLKAINLCFPICDRYKALAKE